MSSRKIGGHVFWCPQAITFCNRTGDTKNMAADLPGMTLQPLYKALGHGDCNEDEREAFQKKVNLSLQKMSEKRLKDDDDDDEALFDTVLNTYKKHCSQARAEKFSAPKGKRTEKKKGRDVRCKYLKI